MKQARKQAAAAIAAAMVMLAGSAAAQVPFAVEGPITDADPARGTISVMGLTISIPQRAPAVPVMSPTAPVTLQDLIGDPLPGRSERGFLGGTAIISGTVLPDGAYEAADVFVEPAENVLRAPLVSSTPLRIGRNSVGQGLEIRPITDRRMPAGPVRNQYGFEVVTATLQPGTLAAVEGYYSRNEDVLYYHTLEIDGNAQLAQPGSQVSVQRAQCRLRGRGRDEIEVRGGVTTGSATPIATGTQVQLTLVQRGGTTRTIAIAPTPAVDPGFGSYVLRAADLSFPAGGCPAQLTVSWRLGAVTLASSPAAGVSTR